MTIPDPMIGQTGEGQHEFAIQYLRRELAKLLWRARKCHLPEDFLLDSNESTRLLVYRCPQPLREQAELLQHKVVCQQLQMYVSRDYFLRNNAPFPHRVRFPRRLNVNKIAPKVKLADGMVG